MPQDSSEFSRGSIDLLKVLMLTGAVVGIISIFQLWIGVDYIFLQFNYPGYELFLRSREYPDSGYFLYLPLLVFIGSAVSVVVSILTFTKHEKKCAAAGLALGVFILVSALLFVFYPESRIMLSDNSGSYVSGVFLMREIIGEGTYSAIAAGIFLIVGGAVILINRKITSSKEEEE